MSFMRPLARLARRPLTRAASTATPAPSSSGSDKAAAANAGNKPGSLTASVYPSTAVPRSADFPNRFPEAPQHKHYNYPERLWSSPEKFPATLGENTSAKNKRILSAVTGYSLQELDGLYRYALEKKRVVNMTKKGKMASFVVVMVVGDPERGLVGIGHGKGENVPAAQDRAFHQAVLSMDAVPRFENRTLYGQGGDLENKWRATKVIMRARPPGFGLQVPHVIHRLFSACGIRDASAQILGSRNKSQVLKCALQIIHGGSLPPGAGTGKSRARRENKGAGMRTLRELERQRGRYGIDVNRHL